MEIVCPACGDAWGTSDPGPGPSPRTCPQCLYTWAPAGDDARPSLPAEALPAAPRPRPDPELEPLLTDEVRAGLVPNPPPPPPPPPSLRDQQDRAFLVLGVSSTALSVAVLFGAIGLLTGAFTGRPAALDPGLVPARIAGEGTPPAAAAPAPARAPVPHDTGGPRWCEP